ncbi:hypothetical protein S245_040220, partial [Arachis hypogaea]
EMCRRNKEVRKKQTISHTETGRKISRREIYIETHKKKDVTDEAKDIVEQIELLMTKNEKDESGPFTNDAIGKVFGEEHSGRVRCLQIGATPTNTFRESKFDGTLTALKAYFLSKEGRILVELTSIFDHGTQ